MRELRNPFKLRASEHIESDSTFLRLFAPGVLDLLPRDSIWTQVQVMHSAPGGGKTSLFRLFTPQSLTTLHDFKNGDEYKDLYQKLKNLDVIGEEGPKALGVMMPLARNYSYLEQITSNGSSQRLLYSLLNSRIILNALRGLLFLHKLPFPAGLEKLQISRPEADIPSTIPVPCNGAELYQWASTLEKDICNSIDSFISPKNGRLAGHDTLYSLFLLTSNHISLDDRPATTQTLVMLDDAHKLTSSQREKLLSNLFEMRMPTGIWIAERLQALKLKELLPSGSKQGRDYNEIVLENSWEAGKNSKLFERTAESIADRRTKLNPDIQIGSFGGCLSETLSEIEWGEKYERSIEEIQRRVKDKYGSMKIYDQWIEIVQREAGLSSKAIKFRVLEILIERDIRDSQQKLSKFMEMPLPEKDFDDQDDSSVRAGGEYFLSREFGLPYYYGFSRIVDLASYNIEQFIELAGELYEEMISAELLKQSSILLPQHQEKILRKITKVYWDRIVKEIPNGRDAVRLLEAISQMCRWQTDKPNAPYSPGVTGFAISMDERSTLTDPDILRNNPSYTRLASTLHTCVSNNLLRAFPFRKQGREGKEWMILYLNRILCMYFGLPLQYGGWKHRPLDELVYYLDHSFRIPRKKGKRVEDDIEEKSI